MADGNARAIALLRIGVGLLFLTFGEYKVFGTAFTLGGGFQSGVRGFLDSGGTYPFMVPVLRGVLAHFGTPMAFAVAWGEFLIGLSLTLGVLSRVASSFGALLMAAMWLSGGWPGAHPAFWRYWGASLEWSVFFLCFLVLMAGRPEQCWAVRVPRKPQPA